MYVDMSFELTSLGDKKDFGVCVETLLEIKEFNLTQQTHPNLRYQIL
jgi:hypothetical protein